MKWNNVKDKLPDTTVDRLLLIVDDCYYLGSYDKANNSFGIVVSNYEEEDIIETDFYGNFEGGYTSNYKVTHWCNIPKKPS